MERDLGEVIFDAIFENEEAHRRLVARATEILGRGPKTGFDQEDDTDWWEAMTRAADEALLAAIRTNNSRVIAH